MVRKDIEFVKQLWQYSAAMSYIKEGNGREAIFCLEEAINSVGIKNEYRNYGAYNSSALIVDPEYDDYDSSIKNLEKHIEEAGFSEVGPAAYAFLFCLIADIYSQEEPWNALLWRNKFSNLLKKYPELNNVDFHNSR